MSYKVMKFPTSEEREQRTESVSFIFSSVDRTEKDIVRTDSVYVKEQGGYVVLTSVLQKGNNPSYKQKDTETFEDAIREFSKNNVTCYERSIKRKRIESDNFR
ncbi:MAG: hypothetical protein ACRC2T_05975 [Thermoguttaceae bacterium]